MTTATASAASRPAPDLRAPALDWRRLASLAAWTALTLFVLLAALLAARRIAGALTQPLPGPILVPLAAGIAAACVLLRLSLLPLRLPSLARDGIRDWLVLVVPSIALAILLAAIMTPGTSPAAALAALLFSVVIEGMFWRHLAVALRPRELPITQQEPPTEAAEEAVAEEVVEEESYASNLLQKVIRTREGSGEAIHVVLRAEFQPGEQMQVLHVAFCPPLDRTPDLEAMTLGELGANVRVTNSHSYGARLEVTLAEISREPLSLLVELTARS